MKFKGIFTAMTALSLVAVPTLAAAAPVATPLTQPASQTVQGDNAAIGGSSLLLLILALAAIGGGVYAATTHNNDRPNSP